MLILNRIYNKKVNEYMLRLKELTDPHTLYVTDLVSCSHKRVLRHAYPHLSLRFEPPLIVGDLIHAGLAKMLEDENEWVPEYTVEKKFEINGTEYRVLGRIDLVKVDSNGEPIHVVEIKTGKELPQNAPLEHHVIQLQLYMNLLEVDKGSLVYITSDALVEYEFDRQPINILDLVRETINDSIHPRYAWECRYCVYRKLCPYAKR
ncbi:MAG TPA: CRISPR-associated protein Cas4 [Pyrodictiaceae archaeon]|nr:CRISPR-associated protein Cas4 [Pyrodictiaceae archaeon]HIQ11066.1 CRISPR-associated protein Cas4 [Pyrodictium sp.]HIQ56334.1 CRISPR-associated protein Cas4 [Pyrodictium sp.]